MKSETLLFVAAAVLLSSVLWTSSDDEPDDSKADIEDIANQISGAVTALGDDTDDMTKEKNLRAFLNALCYGEGTASENGYRILCGGGTFDSFEDHPAVLGWRGLPLSEAMCKGAGLGAGCVSTAAGKYQITKPTWLGLKSKLGLPDFSPESQDAAAIELIRQRGALDDVQAGRIATAVQKCAKTWASLPSAGYGQREVRLSDFIRNYQKEGGALV